MVQGMIWLVLAYSLSQFYRACLSVFAPVLQIDIGFTADEASTALGLWFLAFAAMQIPVGWLLDNKSPRLTASTLLLFGAGSGALVFALAQGPIGIYIAMTLIGIGCSPVLMTAFYIFARTAPSNRFGTLAGLIVGIGSLGNLAASVPLSLSLEWIGWRNSALVLAALTVVVAGTLFVFLKDPVKAEQPEDGPSGGLRAVLTNWALYPIFAIALVNYAPSAAIRGSWGGAYLAEIYGMDVVEIGRAISFMAIAMILGSLAFGPIDRVIRSRKLIVLGGVSVLVSLLWVLWFSTGTLSAVQTTVLFIAIGFFGSTYGQVMNHGRTLLPAHLTGRGVTLINLFSMSGAGLSQVAAGRIFTAHHSGDVGSAAGYAAVFGFFTIAVIVGIFVYIFSVEREG